MNFHVSGRVGKYFISVSHEARTPHARNKIWRTIYKCSSQEVKLEMLRASLNAVVSGSGFLAYVDTDLLTKTAVSKDLEQWSTEMGMQKAAELFRAIPFPFSLYVSPGFSRQTKVLFLLAHYKGNEEYVKQVLNNGFWSSPEDIVMIQEIGQALNLTIEYK
ncbi:hypothetical protein A3J90_08800 [candidate division WOR-1 bacterium RIFOXYC2_FULL_37_10]|uniref:Uncharacterized protein n=1 Tax=candidate division WOR-1 bacterium RIFOXYB2_FULL_37_13 TaxID=1802579 RepID=A0A1F4SQQ7_UNCSA|nr:MAG: hypothetical protein A2246_03765 [candidate division WOR-1 bacterium RIFOXYA2_FULL_37_7]OGC22043.1 MAG: hypothetical protein A2310_07080 [candidate division WOR-1 bacterium RIFOXYB2_FULL_37_13]OGC33071.1 MAG: hypothetical protein A3J90_08800 [candidate division WOR-1 bacterium RIFOXYC2_FULL_37_10]